MAGKPSHAQKLANHLGADVDAACMIDRAGATANVAIGGVVGMAAGAALNRKATGEEIRVSGNGWLAIGPRSFALVKGDKFLGKPKGEPYAEIPFVDVERVEVKDGRLTTRAEVTLVDGRTFAFETRRKGPNRQNPEVLALLAQRCR